MNPGSAVRRGARLLLAGALLAVAGCAQGAGSTGEFCDQLDRLADPEEIFDVFDRQDRIQDVNRVAAAEDLEDVADELRDLERDAPRQIKADVADLADFTAEVASRVRKYGDDDQELQSRLIDLAQSRLGTATSALKVSNYAQSECGIDLQGSPGTDSGFDPDSDLFFS